MFVLKIADFGTHLGQAVSPTHSFQDRTGATVDHRSPLEMRSNIPSEVSISEGGILEGSVTLTNVSQSRYVGISGMSPDVTVTLNGEVVAPPLGRRSAAIGIELDPGESQTLRAAVRLWHRDDPPLEGTKGDNNPPRGTLSAGVYQLYAELEVRPNLIPGTGDDVISVRGGPWELRVSP